MKFTDCKGRDWDLVLTVSTLKPLGEILGHKPKEALTDPGKMTDLLGDPEKIVAVTHLLANPPESVTPEEFAAGFDVDALERAGECVLRSLAEMYGGTQAGKAAGDKIVAALREAGKAVADGIAGIPIADAARLATPAAEPATDTTTAAG